jgi:hypothetical protein
MSDIRNMLHIIASVLLMNGFLICVAKQLLDLNNCH